MPEAFAAADVPALRRDLAEWMKDGRGMRFHRRMSRTAGSMTGHPELDDHPDMMRAWAEMVTEHESRVLASAEMYFVTAEMTAIIRQAADSMPAFAPAASDFPSPSGLIVYAAPLVEFDRPEEAAALIVGGKVVLDFRDDPYEHTRIVAVTWGPYDAGGNWPRGGVMMSFYVDRADMLDRALDDRVRRDVRGELARLVPDNECGIAYPVDADAQVRTDASLREHDSAGYTSSWAKYLLATLLLMRQPLVYQRTEPIRRSLRRQLERAGHPVGDIKILDARPHTHANMAGADPGDEQPPAVEGTGRKVRVRFPVPGFWRNQWYASRGVHRPKWIEEHWRGPEGAPIVHAEKVRVLRDGPTAPPVAGPAEVVSDDA